MNLPMVTMATRPVRHRVTLRTVRPNENDLPSFGDDESVSRSVDENVKGASVGDPVTAVDDNPLLYTLSGDGSDAFSVDTSGQITTAKTLDYEARSSYTITVTATDPCQLVHHSQHHGHRRRRRRNH